MGQKDPVAIFWFRRDLRLHDNAGLYHALKSGVPVLPIFIFDTDILDDLKNKEDKRVEFIYNVIADMHAQLAARGSSLKVMHGTPMSCFKQLAEEYAITSVYTSHDYEPYAHTRDKAIADFLKTDRIELHTFKDQVIFERSEVVKDNGEPYTVYTPFSKKWKEKLNDFYLSSYPVKKYAHNYLKTSPIPMPSLASMGFTATGVAFPKNELNEGIAVDYDKTRDYPAIHGTTRMSLHLRFGTVSIRELARETKELNGTLLNELIWREFYMMILWHFPHVVGGSFKREYDNIQWRNNEQEFAAWCEGKTGVAIVDAGMRELNETGFMHNRVRMIVASFLTKNLLIDWRWGEAYFAEKLLDYDLSANNGGWQWAAGSGCDAAPYFRIFSPQLQTEKFDPQLKYVRKWVPEFESFNYRPIIDIKASRDRCLKEYKRALGRE
ncbi:deoxyribodipyrimidine photolyase [Flavipsychrobacter stenotrophus]|uniref:Deoxyribodipyrimidine photolyase n=1 Tax=Flavipsychrobacter stenotrophus TaxID=2077091 RepID=A0A2S7SYT3_9BACT|nr:deoxyribodipyrimidine photo-lyase [Flavipsychrobacter stenotrophus]PQJ12110.1 deoxyribodipyrimidine photolyase [Flavipsychrobacter stenotrophus]